MELKKYRWSKLYEPAEKELLTIFDDKHIAPKKWFAEPAEIFEPHVHSYDKQLWCVEGTITFLIDQREVSLQSGDALDLPANTMHEATAGLIGCFCYELRKDS